jgi:hypothetical protein
MTAEPRSTQSFAEAAARFSSAPELFLIQECEDILAEAPIGDAPLSHWKSDEFVFYCGVVSL